MGVVPGGVQAMVARVLGPLRKEMRNLSRPVASPSRRGWFVHSWLRRKGARRSGPKVLHAKQTHHFFLSSPKPRTQRTDQECCLTRLKAVGCLWTT